jgi:uncharacterized protein (DUF1697 family)
MKGAAAADPRKRVSAPSYVALIRGINNIGATRRVAMADLRDMFEGLGFGEVRTLLNSGNVIFSSADVGRRQILARIEAALAAELGLTSRVILLSGQEVARAVRDNPFSRIATNPSRFLVVVPRERSDRKLLRPLVRKRWAPERLALGDRVAYVWCANGVGGSALWAAVDRAFDRSATARNIATMTKLEKIMAGAR